jgi:hypothetical protein
VFTLTSSFDTFSSSNYTWEAEDYDYDGGQYFDNPQTNAYAGLVSTATDAYHVETSGDGTAYRDVAFGLGNEAAGDTTRAQYTTGQVDYDVGWNNAGNWANYTRHYPAGTYNIYMRASNVNAAGTDNAEFSGAVSGRFGIPSTGAYQTYTWSPLVDANGDIVEFTTDGSAKTIKLLVVNAGFNMNFFMLSPVESASVAKPTLTAKISGQNIVVSFPTQSGVSYQLVYRNSLTDTTETSVGSPVVGDGTTKTISDTLGQSYRFYRVKATAQ